MRKWLYIENVAVKNQKAKRNWLSCFMRAMLVMSISVFCSPPLQAQTTGLFKKIIQTIVPKKDTILFQTVKGQILSEATSYPLSGASVVLITDSAVVMGASSDALGQFQFRNVLVDRHRLRVSFVGYKSVEVSIPVSSSKETVLDIRLEESAIELEAVEVSSTPPPNYLASVGGTVINPDELSRYPGIFGGEAIRKVAVRPEVQSADDSRNDIVIRGNAPGSVIWRLEGVNIHNPNHFNIAGTAGGPVTQINDKMLGTSAFYTGALPAEFGNTTSGIFDLHFRTGATERHNKSIQLGMLGAEFFVEGPLSEKKTSSYMFSARAGALALVRSVLDIGTEAKPFYYDAAFKITLPGRKSSSSLSFFGLGGYSHIDILISDEIRNIYGENDRDQYFRSGAGTTGLVYKNAINKSTYLTTTLAYSAELIKSHHNFVVPAEIRYAILQKDNESDMSVFPLVLGYLFKESRISNSFALAKTLKRKGNTFNAGMVSDLYFFNYLDTARSTSPRQNNFAEWRIRWNSRERSVLLQPFVQWKYIREKTDLTIGIHSQYFSLSQSFSPFEPRLSFKYYLNEKQNQNLNFGFGLHSQTQAKYLYFYGDSNDEITQQPIPKNKKMDFTRSVHVAAGYEYFFNTHGSGLRLKSEIFYQYLYNVPVYQKPSSYSFLNTTASFVRQYPDGKMVNEGEGKNYGLEVTIDKPFSKYYQFLFTGSLFNSVYRGSDNIWRNTDFNGNYILNSLFIREWRKNQNVISLGTRVSLNGGRRYSPVDYDSSEVAQVVVPVDSERNTLRFRRYFRTDLRFSYKINLKKISHEFSVDIMNIFNTKNVLKQSYIPRGNADPIVYEYQLGLLPFFYYRVEF